MSIENEVNLLEASRKYSDNLNNIYETSRRKREEQFNIFIAISDQYKKENLHSDIIQYILDPKSKGIGSIEFLHLFIDFLNLLTNQNIDKKNFDETTSVKREESRIDILIKNEKSKKAIIIENKINGASDQNNQLVRYYDKVSSSDYNVVAIVYLTLLGGEAPYEEKIKNLVIPISAINNTLPNLSDGFFDKCLKITKSSEIKYIFIKQYIELLQIIGENFMTQDFREELLIKLYENIDITKNITDVWNNRRQIIAKILINNIKIEKVNNWIYSSDVAVFDFPL